MFTKLNEFKLKPETLQSHTRRIVRRSVVFEENSEPSVSMNNFHQNFALWRKPENIAGTGGFTQHFVQKTQNTLRRVFEFKPKTVKQPRQGREF